MNNLTATPTIEAPSTTYFLQEYKIEIEFMSRGAVIRVGCKSIPFENISEMMSELKSYVLDPQAAQDKWRKLL